MRAVRSRWLTWLLLTALVVTQCLALVHGVLHARASALPGDAVVVALEAGPQTASAATPAPVTRTHAWLLDLFGGHQHAVDCQLFDQAAGGAYAPPLAKVVALPVDASQAPPRWTPRSWVAAVVPLFQARAPPALG